MTETRDWRIPPRVWAILLSWGLAVFMLASLFAFWTWKRDEAQDKRMCALTGVLVSGPEPEATSESADRSRRNRQGIRDWQTDTRCSRFD